jgi:hypothetical protein
MILISHRGNLNGPNSCLENHPDSIKYALSLGYDCEIDVWKIDENFFLGHDLPQFEIEKEFLFKNLGLWIHCKNFEALEDLSLESDLKNNIFFHNKDDYTLTSKGIIWAYPGKNVRKNCVRVQLGVATYPKDIYGICSDCVALY